MDEMLRQLKKATLERIRSSVAGRFALALYVEIQDDDIFGMSAEMAYRFLFAIFPLMLFLVSSLGFVGNAIGMDNLFERLMAQARPFLPAQVSDIVDRYVTHLLTTQSGAFLTVGILGTLWGAAGGVGTLIKGLNRAYDVRTPRPFWMQRLISVSVLLILPPTGILLLTLVVLGRNLALFLGDITGVGDAFVEALALGRWPVLVLLLFLLLSGLYHRLPNIRHRYVWTLPGAVVATTGWLAVTQGFSVYLSNFGNYDATYGSFGAAIAFLLWLYFAGAVVLVGAEVNALVEPTRRKEWRVPPELSDT